MSTSDKSPFVTPKTSKFGNASFNSPKVVSKTSKTPDCFKSLVIGTPIVSDKNEKLNEYQKDVADNQCNVFPHEKPTEENISIVVAIRVRPLLGNEFTNPKSKVIVNVNGGILSIDHGENRNSLSPHYFAFDHCFWSLDDKHPQHADQNTVYQTVGKQLLNSAFEGYNTCLFAYGQTGSGKSYSIMGSETDVGIIQRFGRDLFDTVNCNSDKSVKWCVEISFFEIYNEKIHDLLASNFDSNKKSRMRVREHPILGPYVEDLATFVVSQYNDFDKWLSIGNKQRATAATGLNEKSSRSHAVLTIVVWRTKTEFMEGKPHEYTRKSKVNIVDLAGSERISGHCGFEYRLKEGVSINKSLLTLGKVISQLADKATTNKKAFIPYRESVLTWLLKESLGGNSKTTMLATVSPSSLHFEETLSTLRYAGKAKNIVNVARVNDDPNIRLIKALKAEIETLRKRCEVVTQEENLCLCEKVRESEALLEQALKTREEKVDQARFCQTKETEFLEKAGISFEVKCDLPRLINLNPDPHLTETLTYILCEGKTEVGRLPGSLENKVIQLNGSLIEDRHCLLINKNGIIQIAPLENAQTFVNGHLIKKEVQIFHGDRVILGGQHFFRFIHPLQRDVDIKCYDFVYAHTEFLKVQEDKIKEELSNEREKIRKEMLGEIESIKKEHESVMSSQRDRFENHIQNLHSALDEKYEELEKAKKCKSELEILNIRLTNTRLNDYAIEDNLLENDLEPLQTDYLKKIEECFSNESLSMKIQQPLLAFPNEIGLFQLSIMIREANRISKNLNMKIEFHQHTRLTENLVFELMVKVRDIVDHKILEWDVPKFIEKFEIIRNLEDLSKEDLFSYDDLWKDDEDSSVTLSPKIVESFISAYEAVENATLSLAEINCSPNTSKITRNGIVWNKIQSQLKELSFVSNSPLIRKSSEWSINNSQSLLSGFDEITGLVVHGREFELLLKEFSKLYQLIMNLESRIKDKLQGYELKQNINACIANILLMSTKIVTLFIIRAKKTNNLGITFKVEIKNLCTLMISYIQGPNVNLYNTMELSHADRLIESIFECCSLTGKIVASLGVCFSNDIEIQLEIEKHFINGLHSIIFNALETAVTDLEDLNLRITMKLENSGIDSPKVNLENAAFFEWRKILNAIHKWTETFKKLHEETSKFNEPYHKMAKLMSSNSQQIILSFSNLIDNIDAICEIFMAEPPSAEEKLVKHTITLIDKVWNNLESLASLKSDCAESGKKKAKILHSELVEERHRINAIITSIKQKLDSDKSKGSLISSPLWFKGKEVIRSTVNENNSKVYRKGIASRHFSINFEGINAPLSNVETPLINVETPESSSHTSIWTTTSNVCESPNGDNAEWADFTIRI